MRNSFIFVYLLLNLLRAIIYLIWNEQDKLIRIFGGNLEVFLGFLNNIIIELYNTIELIELSNKIKF